jgi:hypothetical protein
LITKCPICDKFPDGTVKIDTVLDNVYCGIHSEKEVRDSIDLLRVKEIEVLRKENKYFRDKLIEMSK